MSADDLQLSGKVAIYQPNDEIQWCIRIDRIESIGIDQPQIFKNSRGWEQHRIYELKIVTISGREYSINAMDHRNDLDAIMQKLRDAMQENEVAPGYSQTEETGPPQYPC